MFGHLCGLLMGLAVTTIVHARCFDPQAIIQRQKRHPIGYIMPKMPYHRAASMSALLTGNGKVSINFTVCNHVKKGCRIAAAPLSLGGTYP